MNYRKLPDSSGFCAFRPLAKRWVLAGLAYAGALLAVSCSRPLDSSTSVVIKDEISPQPARVGPAAVALSLSDATGKPLPGAHIVIEADMSHPGMSPVFANAKETETGHYIAQLEFKMAGDWVVLLHITLPDGKKIERQIDVRGVRPN